MITIYNDFLSESDFKPIRNFFFGPDISWRWCDNKSEPAECDELDNYQFYHMLYEYNEIKSDAAQLLVPILDKLNSEKLIRAKVNCNPRHTTIVKHGVHIDQPFDCITAIYYINTNDGFTEFQNGDTIESVENRLVTFPSRLHHTGTTCTNQKRRIVINLNYHGITC